jgi:phenazine biosynthesis protein phzE
MSTLLGSLIDAPSNQRAFALLSRQQPAHAPAVEVFLGELCEVAALEDIPLPENECSAEQALVLVPYCQLRERGYACIDDGAPLLVMTIRHQERVPVAEALLALPDLDLNVSRGDFDASDSEYASNVRRIIQDEIGGGEGSNFVLKRTFIAEISDYSPHTALAAFRRLLQQEVGAYWTFLVHAGARTFLGASPERHISVRDGMAMMNPISGTYRYPVDGPTLEGIMQFLADAKETDELYMVVDEELKMMARFCPDGGRVIGPYLKEMSRLAHTEYFIEGRTTADPRKILRDTLFAPTVTGSPIENACRVIARYEPHGRGYYAGVIALLGRESDGRPLLDSSILIRTAEIDTHGRLRIPVGATVVRHSDPMSEADETRAKVLALLQAIGYRDLESLQQRAGRRAAHARTDFEVARHG